MARGLRRGRYVGFHEAGSVERALALHGTHVASADADAKEEGGDESAAAPASKGRPLRVFRCSANKSHARLAQQPPTKGGGPPKRPRDGDGDGGKPNDGQRKGVGWQQRVRQRLHKKLEKKNQKGGKGGVGGAASAAAKAAGVAKTIDKAARRAVKAKGGKAAGAAGTTARAKKEAKERQHAKRAKSKAAKHAKKAAEAKGKKK